MHGWNNAYLFLNGGKKIITLLHDVFKKEKCGTGFLTKSNFIFRDLRNLSLSWIMAWPFGSTSDKPTAPWGSENFVAYYHVCKSHTSIVCERLILKGRGSVAASLKLMIMIWHRLLSIVMQPKYPTNKDVSMVHELSKLFLSRYHEFEKYLERPTKDWDLQNSSCHLMVLLLPDYMKRFGCLRNYWEGGHMGERSITKLKRSLPHGAHLDGSVRTAIRRYFIDVVLTQLMENEHSRTLSNLHNATSLSAQYYDNMLDEGDCPYENVVNNNENSTSQSYDRYRRFRAYKSLQTIGSASRDKQPIAIVFIGNNRNRFFVITWESVKNSRQRTMHPVDCKDGTVVEGTYMIKWQSLLESIDGVDRSASDDEHYIFNHEMASNATACCALPYISILNNNNTNNLSSETFYYIRMELHTELRKCDDGTYVFSYPSLYINSD
jgi:hypothetical protein